MDSLKLTETEQNQLKEIEFKIRLNSLTIENNNLKVELLKNSITQLSNSMNGIIDAFCKLNGKDPEKISGISKEGVITFQEEQETQKEA